MADEFLLEMLWNSISTAFHIGAFTARERLTPQEKDDYIRNCDMCVVVWADATAPSRFRVIAIRGLELVIGSAVEKENMVTRAFPVVDEAAARKLLAQYGDPSWPDQFQFGAKQKQN